MRQNEWGNPDRIGKERPTQPKDCGMTDKRLPRAQVMESDNFRNWFGDIGQDVLGSIDYQDLAVIAIDMELHNYARIGEFIAAKLASAVAKSMSAARYELEDDE